MRHWLFITIVAGILVLVHPKILLEEFISNSDPEYVVFKHTEKNDNGAQTFDVDCWIKKTPPPPMYTTKIFYKQDDDYEQIISMGPFDPCNSDLYGTYKLISNQEFQKHGNMSLDHICPFAEGYFYLRDFSVDFLSDQLPAQIPIGQYKIHLVATIKEDGDEKNILNELLYIRLE